MDENGISGLEEDELNLENFLMEKDDEVKSSYEKTYLKLVADIADLMESSNKKELSVDAVSRINNQIWSLVDDW